MRFRDDFVGSCDRVRRRCAAGLLFLASAAVLASRGFLRAGWCGTRGPDAAGHASRLVAHAGRAAALGCGSMPASLGSALQGHRHQRPARVPVPRLAVRTRRCGGRDPPTGGGGVTAPVGVPAGAAHGRGIRHGLDLPGTAAAGSDPDHPRVRRPQVRPHRDRSDPLPRPAPQQSSTTTPTPPTSHSSTQAPSARIKTRVCRSGRCNVPRSASRSATGRCRSPAHPPRNDRAPDTR